MLNKKAYIRMAIDLVEDVLRRGGHLRCKQAAVLADSNTFRAYQLKDEKEMYSGPYPRTAAEVYVGLVGGFEATGHALGWLRKNIKKA